MTGQFNSKVVGATVIGFALVASAFVVSNLAKPVPSTQRAYVSETTQTTRTPIAVADSDNNGIEDWRDDFVVAKPVIITSTSSTYTLPETLTGQMSIGFLEEFLSAKTNGPFGSSNDELIENTVNRLGDATSMELYSVSDVDVMQTWEDQDIVNYANTLAATIQRYNDTSLDSQLNVLQDVVQRGATERVADLIALAEVFRNYRDDSLQIPVPAFLLKEHLDLINTYHAIYTDIDAMSKVLEDPALTLLRLKRYEDDVLGFSYALENMFTALEPHATLFTVDDPAVLFVLFSPYYTGN